MNPILFHKKDLLNNRIETSLFLDRPQEKASEKIESLEILKNS